MALLFDNMALNTTGVVDAILIVVEKMAVQNGTANPITKPLDANDSFA
ncbi:MAG: hypothetical protein ACC631_06570 [Halocynthiibacter sp.]